VKHRIEQAIVLLAVTTSLVVLFVYSALALGAVFQLWKRGLDTGLPATSISLEKGLLGVGYSGTIICICLYRTSWRISTTIRFFTWFFLATLFFLFMSASLMSYLAENEFFTYTWLITIVLCFIVIGWRRQQADISTLIYGWLMKTNLVVLGVMLALWLAPFVAWRQ